MRPSLKNLLPVPWELPDMGSLAPFFSAWCLLHYLLPLFSCFLWTHWEVLVLVIMPDFPPCVSLAPSLTPSLSSPPFLPLQYVYSCDCLPLSSFPTLLTEMRPLVSHAGIGCLVDGFAWLPLAPTQLLGVSCFFDSASVLQFPRAQPYIWPFPFSGCLEHGKSLTLFVILHISLSSFLLCLSTGLSDIISSFLRIAGFTASTPFH